MACDSDLLVTLVEKRSSIYDFNHKDHSNRTIQDKLWEEISMEMNVNGKLYIKLLCNYYSIFYTYYFYVYALTVLTL